MFLLTISIPFVLETLILGILASLVASLCVELLKNRRKKFHVSVFLDSSEVYSSQEGNDVHIKVDYKGRTIDTSLVILYVSITNDGQNDIMFKSHFSDAIRICCGGYRFLSISTVENKVQPECILSDDGSALLSWDILKTGEQIKLCIAAQSEAQSQNRVDGAESFNRLEFVFRSDCIDEIISSRELTKREMHSRHLLNSSIMKYVLFIAVFFMFFLYDVSFSSRYVITYDDQSYRNATLLYSPLFNKYLLSSDSASAILISKADIHKVTTIVPQEAFTTANRLSAVLEALIILSLIMTIISIFLNRLFYFKYRKQRRS